MGTLKQQETFKDTIENLKRKNPLTKGELLLKNNYAPSVALHPDKVFDSKYFQKRLARLDDTKIIEKWYEWSTEDTDKRNAIQAGRNILELKNRFPDKKIDVELSRKREELFEDENIRQSIAGEARLDTDSPAAGNIAEVAGQA